MKNMSIIKRDVTSLEVANKANTNHLASAKRENTNSRTSKRSKRNDAKKTGIVFSRIEVQR